MIRDFVERRKRMESNDQSKSIPTDKPGKGELKKKKKLEAIRRAAHELFISQGIQSTTVEDIAGKAGVAKGTFYLYFKDKGDLVEEIVLKQTSRILEDAMMKVGAREDVARLSIQDKVIGVVDDIIDFFTVHPEFLSMVYKNLSMGLYHIPELTQRPVISQASQAFIRDVGGEPKRAERKLYLIIELVGSVCYNAILSELPCPMAELKPDLYDAIGGILS